jgi:hypothetical protein
MQKKHKKRIQEAKLMLGSQANDLNDIMEDVCDYGMSDIEIKQKWNLTSKQLVELKKLLL